MQNIRTGIPTVTYSHFGAFSNKCTKSKKTHLKSDTGAYLFAFNGHEKDDEIKGDGNHFSFGDYGYDSRLGKRWNIEPEIGKYPSNSSYLVFGNNPIINMDPDGEDKVYFNLDGTENYREKSNTEFRTFIMANSKAGNPQISVVLWKEVAMPKIIPERVQSNEVSTGPQYQENDYVIAARVGYFNQAKNSGKLNLYTEGGNAIPQDVVKSIPDLDPTLVKSIALQESHLGTTGNTDIMQSNVNGDWNEGVMKSKYSLKYDVKPNVTNSLYAGIRILATKGFKNGIKVQYDNKAGVTTSTYTFQGWDAAAASYNSTAGTKGYQGYVETQQNNATPPNCSNYTSECR